MHKSLLKIFLGSLLALAAMAGAAAAQYQPIPNFTGIGAGFNFRQAINQHLSGAQPIAPQIVGLSFASLPSEQDGLLLWCKNCQATSPCSAGGAGAWAMGSRGAWACAAPALEQDLNANGHNIVAAASVQAEQPGDSQYRELLVPGNGIKVGNGATTPFTAIDESANISGHVNGVINVKAPPYLAKGDGTTGDDAAIQSALTAACNQGSNKSEVYLPATPGSLCYKTTEPLLISCAERFNGAGWQSTHICQNYLGPTLIVQPIDSGWKPPLASSVTAAWIASHAYGQYKEVLDSNGNVEVATTAGTSGSGSHPTWPTSNGRTVSDGSVTWTRAMTGTQLATGGGSALDAVSPEFYPGAGSGSNNATMELGNPGGPNDGVLNGLAHFTVEFYVEVFGANTTASNQLGMVGVTTGLPGRPSDIDALTIQDSGAIGSCTQNCLQAYLVIGGSRVAIQPTSADDSMSVGVIHHIALTYDGTTARLFLDGNMPTTGGSHSASGTLTVPRYSSFMIADIRPNIYPGMQYLINTATAYYDSLRVSNTARYTANFTKPTAKFTSDSNTTFLLNFPTGTPTGTMEGFSGPGGGSSENVFIPLETTNSNELSPVYIGNMSLSDNGIYANWMLNSTIENIQIQGAGRTCINLHDNDFQDTIHRAFCTIVPSAKTSVGFLFMNASSDNLYDHLQCDGQPTCIEQASGSGRYVSPAFTDRGQTIYPFAFIQAQAVLDSPEADVEASEATMLGDVYSNGGYAPVIIRGGQLLVGGGTSPSLAIDGGSPFIVEGSDFGSSTAAELVNIISNPTSPVVIKDSVLPSGVPLTNSGKSWWLRASLGGQDLGVKFADIPAGASGNNGTRRYCLDCDPPANPPVACTSAGAKTGAWINGLNNTWICVP